MMDTTTEMRTCQEPSQTPLAVNEQVRITIFELMLHGADNFVRQKM